MSSIPTIPTPTSDPQGMMFVLTALKAAVEVMVGRRGDLRTRAVTVNDLIQLGVITQAQADSLKAL